jgi:hypothetical protein
MGIRYQHGMGTTAAQDVSIAGGAITQIAAATGPAAPIVALVGAAINLAGGLMSMLQGCGSTCTHDTQIVESFFASFHCLLYTLTGEILPGIPGVSQYTSPGNYGNAGINLFGPSQEPAALAAVAQAAASNTAYTFSAVPYPLGNAPGAMPIAQAISALTSSYQTAMGQLERTQSQPNLTNNYNYAMGLLQSIQQAQEQYAAQAAADAAASGTTAVAASTASTSIGTTISNWWNSLPAGWGQPAAVIAGVVIVAAVIK